VADGAWRVPQAAVRWLELYVQRHIGRRGKASSRAGQTLRALPATELNRKPGPDSPRAYRQPLSCFPAGAQFTVAVAVLGVAGRSAIETSLEAFGVR